MFRQCQTRHKIEIINETVLTILNAELLLYHGLAMRLQGTHNCHSLGTWLIKPRVSWLYVMVTIAYRPRYVWYLLLLLMHPSSVAKFPKVESKPEEYLVASLRVYKDLKDSSKDHICVAVLSNYTHYIVIF